MLVQRVAVHTVAPEPVSIPVPDGDFATFVVRLVAVEAAKRVDMVFQLLEDVRPAVDELVVAGEDMNRRRHDRLLVADFVRWIAKAVRKDVRDVAL